MKLREFGEASLSWPRHTVWGGGCGPSRQEIRKCWAREPCQPAGNFIQEVLEAEFVLLQ